MKFKRLQNVGLTEVYILSGCPGSFLKNRAVENREGNVVKKTNKKNTYVNYIKIFTLHSIRL